MAEVLWQHSLGRLTIGYYKTYNNWTIDNLKYFGTIVQMGKIFIIIEAKFDGLEEMEG